jgi:N-acetylmuramoyl-L-alanine amidase
MIRVIQSFIVISIIFSLSTFCSMAEFTGVRLIVDGVELITDTPATIVQERTLVPARAVFEAMGGTVEWNEGLREVTILLHRSEIKLTIDSKDAFVEGKLRTLDVPASIIDGRTMVPVRFIAESAGSTVEWDNDNRIVQVTSPGQEQTTELDIVDIVVEETDASYNIKVVGNNQINVFKDFILASPDRFVLDIQDATLKNFAAPAIKNSDVIKSVRFSQFEVTAVRVVVDLNDKVPGRISKSDDGQSLVIEFNKKGIDPVVDNGLPELDWRVTNLLVVIDPGHGGKDTGAIAFEDTIDQLYEKEVNLDVALRINELLTAAGVNIKLLRYDDLYIGLQERPALANAMSADLYIGIHTNSSDNLSARGIEVLYYTKNTEADYNIFSRHFADIAQAELLKEMGIPDRTVKERPLLAVLNKTIMPAIIVEGGFMSNPDDIQFIKTEAYREKYALAVARSIIVILNESLPE